MRRTFEHEIWEVHQQGPEPGTDADKAADSDEDIVVGNSSALAPNNLCPLTLLPVSLQCPCLLTSPSPAQRSLRLARMQLLEIKNPVMDEKGYVYEKQAMVDYIRQRGAGQSASSSKDCPVAGERVCTQSCAQEHVVRCIKSGQHSWCCCNLSSAHHILPPLCIQR